MGYRLLWAEIRIILCFFIIVIVQSLHNHHKCRFFYAHVYSNLIQHSKIWARPWKTWLSSFFLFGIAKFRSERKNISKYCIFLYMRIKQTRFSPYCWPRCVRFVCLIFIFILLHQNFVILKGKMVLTHVFHGLANGT